MNQGDIQTRFNGFFVAQIVDVTLVAEQNLYSWVEQTIDGVTASYSPAVGGRFGNANTQPLIEINNSYATPPFYAFIRFRGVTQSQGCYEFWVGSASAQQPSSSSSSGSESTSGSESESTSQSVSESTSGGSGGGAIAVTETDVLCQDGVLNVYNRLNHLNGSVGNWYFVHSAGCCECGSTSSTSTSGSGGPNLIYTTCCDNPFPTTLHGTITSSCTAANGSITLLWNGTSWSCGPCGPTFGGSQNGFNLTCADGVWQISQATNLCYEFTGAASSPTCDPIMLTFTTTITSLTGGSCLTCIGNTVTLTITS